MERNPPFQHDQHKLSEPSLPRLTSLKATTKTVIMPFPEDLSRIQITFFQQQFIGTTMSRTSQISIEGDWSQFWQEYRELEQRGFIESNYDFPNPKLTPYSNYLSPHTTQQGSSTASSNRSSSPEPLSFHCTFCSQTSKKKTYSLVSVHLSSYDPTSLFLSSLQDALTKYFRLI